MFYSGFAADIVYGAPYFAVAIMNLHLSNVSDDSTMCLVVTMFKNDSLKICSADFLFYIKSTNSFLEYIFLRVNKIYYNLH